MGATHQIAGTPRWMDIGEARSRFTGERHLTVDRTLLAIVVGLTLFGVVMVYSASAFLAEQNYESHYYFLLRQGGWAVLGLGALTIGMFVDYRRFRSAFAVVSLLAVTIALLVAVYFFPERNSTHRWITWGYFSLQPSEIAKLTLVVFLAFFIERRLQQIASYWRVFVPAAMVSAIICGLVVFEPDLGTAVALGAVFALTMFHAGVPMKYLLSTAAFSIPLLVYLLVEVPWRLQRLFDFLDPWANPTTSGFQIVQSLIAIGSGGLHGLGFAAGKQKLFYLPAPHSDFIFAVIGEELGLVGAGSVVLLFALLVWRGLKAARSAPDMFGQLLAVGLTVTIGVQAFFNISVALSLVPTKGIPLPFISAGGSSLAICLFSAGVLLNISKHGKT